MTKYHKYFTDMMTGHQAQFDAFKVTHDKYEQDWKSWQEAFNEEGGVIVAIVRDYEMRLCAQMERGANSKYSANLSDKFWQEVRMSYPMIDFVGTKRS